MGSKIFSVFFSLFVIFIVSCASGPETVEEPAALIIPEQPASQPVAPEPAAPVVETFDPRQVSQQQYNATMTEVRQFIDRLNSIINNRNYNGWRAALSDEYFARISSPENLREWNEQPAMRTRGITLRNAQDYFTHVVVPSRANSQVDEIEFLGNNRVKAFYNITNNRGEIHRLRLYDLEKISNTWKIID